MSGQIYINPKSQSQIRQVFADINVCFAQFNLAIADVGTLQGVGGEVLALGEIVRYDGVGAFVKAQADSLANAAAIGGVQEIVGLDIRVAQSDTIPATGLTPGARYFLSAVTAGAIVTAPDSTSAGAVSLCVGYALSATELHVEIGTPIVY